MDSMREEDIRKQAANVPIGTKLPPLTKTFHDLRPHPLAGENYKILFQFTLPSSACQSTSGSTPGDSFAMRNTSLSIFLSSLWAVL